MYKTIYKVRQALDENVQKRSYFFEKTFALELSKLLTTLLQ